MPLLARANYDPAVAVTSAATTGALAMTALDTTNLRVTFTAPANGMVLVRGRVCAHGASTLPQLLLGVLDSTTVRLRQIPNGGRMAGASTERYAYELEAIVTGLTPSTSYTWDFAYGVEFGVALTALKWGGPNDTTTDNAWGAAAFEVWTTENLLAAAVYDPGTAVAKATSARLAMTALDTTNLRCTFNAPASGNVFWRLRGGGIAGATTFPSVLLGILEGATVVARQAPMTNMPGTALATTNVPLEASGVLALTPFSSHTYDAAYGVEILLASTNLNYGGPNDTTASNAWGQLALEVWAA